MVCTAEVQDTHDLHLVTDLPSVMCLRNTSMVDKHMLRGLIEETLRRHSSAPAPPDSQELSSATVETPASRLHGAVLLTSRCKSK